MIGICAEPGPNQFSHLGLSQQRADAVRDVLIADGVQVDAISMKLSGNSHVAVQIPDDTTEPHEPPSRNCGRQLILCRCARAAGKHGSASSAISAVWTAMRSQIQNAHFSRADFCKHGSAIFS